MGNLPRQEAMTPIAFTFLPFLLLALTAVWACSPRPATPVDTPPDVVLITLDTMRADHLSAYGHPTNTTPNLDQLASRGTRFDLAISSSALTPVSHASILTGLYNHEHGLRVLSAESGFQLADEIPTLATMLSAAGYRTAAIHSSFAVSAHFGLDRGFESFESFRTDVDAWVAGDGVGLKANQRRSDETSDLVLEYLEEAASPYFLWIHYWDPHDDALVPPAADLPEQSELRAAQQIPDLVARLSKLKHLVYTAEVRYQDGQIGRVLRALERQRSDGKTLVAVVGDHGEGLGDHMWWSHRLLYQEQIRVPLILSLPGVEQRPVVDALVRTVDIAPTILDALGLDPGSPLSGVSLRGLIEGREEPGRIAFADQINGYDVTATMLRQRPFDDFLYTVMDARQKFTYRPAHPERSELFELKDDPTEQVNLYDIRPYDVMRWQQKLAHEAPWVTAPFPPGDGSGVSEATIAALEALGYLARDDGVKGDPGWNWICPDRPSGEHGDADDPEDCLTPLIPIRRPLAP